MATFAAAQWRSWWPRLVFLTSAVTVAAGAAGVVSLPLMRPLTAYGFFDLRVYRAAVHVVALGEPLYTAHLRHGLGFTYPPFAVLVMMPLRWLSLVHAEQAVTLGDILLVAIAAHAAVRMRGPAAGSARAGWVAAAIALWAEPVISTIGYGQIDLLIATLVIVDIAYGGRTRIGGIGIGLAAALKLTPLIFIPYLLLTRRGRMAGRAAGAFALSIAVAFVTVPRDALRYWSGTVFDISRVTGRHHLSGAGPANQSLRGALLRLLPGLAHVSVVWLPACVLVAAGERAARIPAHRDHRSAGLACLVDPPLGDRGSGSARAGDDGDRRGQAPGAGAGRRGARAREHRHLAVDRPRSRRHPPRAGRAGPRRPLRARGTGDAHGRHGGRASPGARRSSRDHAQGSPAAASTGHPGACLRDTPLANGMPLPDNRLR